MSGHEGIVKLLLNKRSPSQSLNVADICGRTPLILAVVSGHEEIVRLLLQVNGVDVNREGDVEIQRTYPNKLNKNPTRVGHLCFGQR